MNIFLPYPTNIDKSIRCLDDVRLTKQILECQTMIDVASGAIGYSNHPIVKHYTKDQRQIRFVRYYGFKCCKEFEYRFGKKHAYAEKFPRVAYFFGTPQYEPLYLEGRKPKQLIETDPKEIEALFQQKLTNKWINDKFVPKWTKRDIPKFFADQVSEETFLEHISIYQAVQIARIIKRKEREKND